jgi:hypothetical protein
MDEERFGAGARRLIGTAWPVILRSRHRLGRAPLPECAPGLPGLREVF